MYCKSVINVLIQFFGFFFFVKLIQNSIMCKKISSKSKVKRRSRVVTFIPNNEVEAVERPTFWDLRRNYSLETFDCWSSHQCPKCCQRCHHSNNNNNTHNAPTNQSWSDHHQTKACFLEASTNPAYHHQHHHHHNNSLIMICDLPTCVIYNVENHSTSNQLT